MDTIKLSKLVEIDKHYADGMETWIEGIPELIQKAPLAGADITAPIEKKVGIVRPDGFEIDLNKMEVGKGYYFDYGNSKYRAKKNETGELLLYEIG